MNRDLVINILLVVVGIVLAFLLFAAGVLWKSKTSAGRPSASIAGPAEQTDRNLAAERPNSEGNMPDNENAGATSGASAVVINCSALFQQQLQGTGRDLWSSASPGSLLVRHNQRNVGLRGPGGFRVYSPRPCVRPAFSPAPPTAHVS